MTNKGNFVYWFIAVLLLALLSSNIYFAALAYQERQAQVEYAEARQAAYQEHVQQMQTVLDRQRQIIADVSDSYHADAYDPGIERIAEQQLIAAEYHLLLLQVIAQQNAQTLELLMARP